jgi:hypothetical protein
MSGSFNLKHILTITVKYKVQLVSSALIIYRIYGSHLTYCMTDVLLLDIYFDSNCLCSFSSVTCFTYSYLECAFPKTFFHKFMMMSQKVSATELL